MHLSSLSLHVCVVESTLGFFLLLLLVAIKAAIFLLDYLLLLLFIADESENFVEIFVTAVFLYLPDCTCCW